MATRKLTIQIDGDASKGVKAFKDAKTAAADAGDGVEKVGGKLDGLLGKMQDLGKAVAVAGGAAVAAGLVAGFQGALEREKFEDRFVASLGSGEAAQAAGKLAGELYSDAYGESIGQVGEAIRSGAQSGLFGLEDDTEATIKNISAQVLDLAAVTGEDVAAITRSAGQLIRTGLARDSAEAMDILAAGFTGGLDVSGEFLDTLDEYGTQFRALGLSGVEALGLIRQGMQGGARGADVVADALKEFAIRAIDGSEASREAFSKLGDLGVTYEEIQDAVAQGGDTAKSVLGDTLAELKKVEDPSERAAIATALFGEKANDLQAALGSLDLDTATASFGDISQAAETMGDTLNDNAATKIEAFKRQALEKLTAFVGDKVIPTLEKIGEWAQNNKGPVIAIAAVIGGVLVAAFAAWAVSAASAAVATIAATWPILAIGAAVAALAAGIIWAYQNVDWFRSAVDAVGRFLRDTLWPLIQTGIDKIGDLIGVVWDAGTRFGEWIRRMDFGQIVELIKSLPDRAKAALWSIGARMWDAVNAGINHVVRNIRAVGGRIGEALADTARGGFNNLASQFGLDRFGIKFGATGGIVTQPTLAVIGEAGPEVLIPLTDPRRALELASDSGLLNVLAGRMSIPAAPPPGGGGSGTTVVVNVAGSVLSERDLVDVIARAQRRGTVGL